ncbi:hypothetical protein HMPREF1990_01127 [Porphyromonas gingivalis W4087]|uniref:hypothetical protein n=1 Tax=Porphyromonas gingivalis TaxID=837 RepID=UPI0003ACDDD2|nr:hypothetical protein [Porphyromonas gingivalis]ERJ88862.1 hypothetical protein HMPREF1990_01127 [Porphyromonas gingivalis W4087]PDP63302.1 hypothetical protein CLI83_00125 [Porphyromonas gingivalis]PDP76015.1 hypothetical protein CLI79_00120 [Porphyromonas gingivalis]
MSVLKKRGYIGKIQNLLKALLKKPEKFYVNEKAPTTSNTNVEEFYDELEISPDNQEVGDKIKTEKPRPSDTEEILRSLSKDKEEEILSAVNAQFWAYFALSLLTGEYLRHADYSYSLETIVKDIKEKYYKGESREFLHPILPVAHNLCQNLLHKCLLMRQQIEVTNGNQTHFFPEETIALSSDYSRYEEQGREIKEAEYIQKLGLKLIEMTSIDFLGIIDEEKIKSLANLYNLCEEVLASPEKHIQIFEKEAYTTKGRQVIEGSGRYIIDAIKIKTSLLLYQSFFRPSLQLVPTTQDESIEVFSFDQKEDEKEKSLYGALKKLQVVFRGKRYDDPKELIQLDCVHFWKEKFYESLEPLSPISGKEHITCYDEFIHKSCAKRKTWKELLNEKNDIDEDNEKYVFEKIGYVVGKNDNSRGVKKQEIVPFDVILRGLKFLEEKHGGEKKSGLDWSKPIDQMDSLLRVFVKQLEDYADKSMPYEKERTFSNSFFRLISDTNSPNLPPIFISSLGCRMLNVVLLRKTKYRLYRGVFRSWLYNAQRDSAKEFSRVKEENRQDLKTATQESNENAKSLLEEWSGKNARELEKVQSSQVVFLGIFSAIIAMLVSLVSSFKFAENVYDFMIMFGSGFSFISGLLAIVVLVKENDENKNIEKDVEKDIKREISNTSRGKCRCTKLKNRVKRWRVSAFVLFLVFVGVGFAVLGICLKRSEKPVSATEKIRFEYEGQQKTELVVEPTSESAEKGGTKTVSDKENLSSPPTEKKNSETPKDILQPQKKTQHKKRNNPPHSQYPNY